MHLDVRYNRLGLYGVLVAHEYRCGHPSAEVVYIPQREPFRPLLPPFAMSSQPRLYASVSVLYRAPTTRTWLGRMNPPGLSDVVEDLMRQDRRRCMRLAYGDIVVDRVAWHVAWPRPDWFN